MLVLSRKKDQKIKIGDDIILTIVAVSGDVVRIGIDAPRSLRVMRLELLETQKQNMESIEDVANGKVLDLLKGLIHKK